METKRHKSGLPACRVKIGNHFWKFRSVPGRQYIKREGESDYTLYLCIRDNAARTISISTAQPIEDQLGAAARETRLLMEQLAAREKNSAARDRRHLGRHPSQMLVRPTISRTDSDLGMEALARGHGIEAFTAQRMLVAAVEKFERAEKRRCENERRNH